MAKTVASATTPATTGRGPSSSNTPTPKSWLTPTNMHVLEAVCDTLIPALDVTPESDPHGHLRRPASAMAVAGRMAELLSDEDQESRNEFRQLLGILRSPAGGLLLLSRPVGFLRMTPAQREKALSKMANSSNAKLRQGFQVLKRLAMFIFYSAPALADGSGADGERLAAGGDNPNWPSLGFTPPPPPPQVPKPIHPLAITKDTTLDVDVIVVGSGAGGGVVAAELAQAGKAVLVLEKGGYYNESDFDGREAGMMPKLYLKRGLQATRDLSVALLAGSCLGGGTVVNWSTSFRAPDSVLQEWERNYGLSGFAGPEFASHYAAVEQRMGVNTDDSSPNANNAVIERGCTKLGYHWGVIPRNAHDCRQRCGACGYGCPYSRKQSTLLTYLQDAADHGARFVVNCSVDTVTIEQGRATGVVATAVDPATGERHRVTARAKAVVVAAGALHSPAVLLRSGLDLPQLGRNLHLHPVVAVSGFYPEPIRAWEGSLQTRYSDQFGNPEDGYGFKLEVAPSHPGLIGMSLPWESGREHKELMQLADHASTMIVLVRDRNGGHVRLDKHGEPMIDYVPGEHERKMLTLGMIEGTKVHLAAGATRVGTLHNKRTEINVPDGGEVSAEQIQAFAHEIEERGLEPNRVILFSAHQMGTCRMAADSRRGVVNNDNAVFGVRGLYVSDGSAFPSATGVNPMLTILALAHRAAQAIKAAI